MGAAPFEAACLETSRARALLHIGVRTMIGHLALSMLVVFLFFFQDYTVPHACWLQVFATELLGWASSSPRAIDTLWPGLLPIVVITPAIAFILATVRREWDAAGQAAVPARRPKRVRDSLPFVIVFMISWVVPIAVLLVKLSSWTALRDAVRFYGSDMAMTLLVAFGTGLLVVVAGIGVQTRRVSWVALTAALMMGLLPGALIGRAVIAGYNHAVAAPVFDNWPAVMLGHGARFGWIGLLAGVVLLWRMERELIDQARIDGAGSGDILWRLHLPLGAPVIMGTIAVVAALSAGEVAATTMLRVPSYSPVALVIIEKFHRFEDDMLISLSLMMVATSLVAALLAVWAVRCRSHLPLFRQSQQPGL
jgi:ABC-type Fe3+ transport system permease subunit